jgi:hypothetical protein
MNVNVHDWQSRASEIYAIEVIGNPNPVMVDSIANLIIDPFGGIWYTTTNKNTVIPLEEKRCYIPPHAIARIAFNIPKYDK